MLEQRLQLPPDFDVHMYQEKVEFGAAAGWEGPNCAKSRCTFSSAQ
jgi:hypothetical protein